MPASNTLMIYGELSRRQGVKFFQSCSIMIESYILSFFQACSTILMKWMEWVLIHGILERCILGPLETENSTLQVSNEMYSIAIST